MPIFLEDPIQLTEGVYDLTAKLSIHSQQIINNLQVLQGEELTGIDFDLPNAHSNISVLVDQGGYGDFTNIPEAVNTVINGDTIIINDGVYTDLVEIIDKTVFLTSKFHFDSLESHILNTIIDGKNSHRCLRIDDAADSNLIITGVTIQNGYTKSGGGVYVRQSTPTFRNCIFQNNSSTTNGGAIWNYYSPSKFYDCVITGNQSSGGGGMSNEYSDVQIYNCEVTHNTAYSGGGIHNYNSSTIIKNSLITENTATGGNGGGVDNLYDSQPEFHNSIISDNNAQYGGGLYFKGGADAILTNNLIYNNSAEFQGGGIKCRWSDLEVLNNTIVNNSANEYGGGIDFYDTTHSNFYNNIIYYNSAPNGSQISISSQNADPNFYYNDIKGGLSEFYFTGSATLETFDGFYENNYNTDPEFAGVEDYSLSEYSICIDNGTMNIPDTLSFGLYDLAGNNRISGDFIDLGAYEWQYTGIENDYSVSSPELFQNYPNPFNLTTTINFSTPNRSKVEITVFNTNGQKVSELVKKNLKQGNHSINFNSEGLNSGLYYYMLKVNGKNISTKRMLLLK